MYQTTHCIAHSDLDGLCAAAVVKQQIPDARIIITNYKKTIRVDKIKPGDIVYVTDFSLSKEVFEIIKNKPCRIIWIDHHESAIKQLTAEGWSCEGIRRTDYSGTALTWMYFNPDKTFDQAPDFIKLVNWYDLWQHDKDPRVRPFSYGVGLWDTRPGYMSGDKFWNKMFSNEFGDKLLSNIVKFGTTIQKYIESYHAALCKDLAYRTMLDTKNGPKKVVAMAIRPGNSSVFEGFSTSDDDAVFTGQYFPGEIKQYKCSMYSPDNKKEILDIACMFGGGGHPTAAGFTLPRYPLNYPPLSTPAPLEESVQMYEKLNMMRKESPILLKYAGRSNSITSRVIGWHTKFEGFRAIAFNHHYIPEMLPVLPTSVECIDEESGDVAELYVGFAMTNSGYFRCCAYPTSTSTKVEDVLTTLQNKHMRDLNGEVYNFKLINGGVWWYQPEEPIHIPINFNLQGSSIN